MICSRCKLDKNDSDFYPYNKSWCKACYSVYKKMKYSIHKDEYKKEAMEWQRNNKDKMKATYEKYRKNNPEKVRMFWKRHRENNRDKHCINEQNRQARKRENGGVFTNAEWEFVKNKYGNRCLSCGKKDVKITIDHVIPISKGGKNIIDNIQPLCFSCNASKGAKIIDYRIEAV